MTSWADFAAAAPELAAAISQRFAGSRYTLLGTLRSDGFPRISGIVVRVRDDRLRLAMRAGATMVADLRRDSRCSLHSGPATTDVERSDVKLHGRAAEITDPGIVATFADSLPHGPPPEGLALFDIDLIDATLIRLTEAKDAHIIDSWRAGESGSRRQVR